MKILITGICGYIGSRFASRFLKLLPDAEIIGIDNLSRRGSETNLGMLKRIGVQFYHGDLRSFSDVHILPGVDWVVDCAANPSVLAGRASINACTSQQLVEHNLIGTLNLLEYCRGCHAGLILLSTSRVYSINALSKIPLRELETRYEIQSPLISDVAGLSTYGVAEEFSTSAPVSLYGATKLASEIMALEYSSAFDFPLWINRCGVIGGPGQLGKIDQGIFSFWVYSCALERPLHYIGFGGSGKQVRDCVLAEDVADLILKQMQSPQNRVPRVINVGGGLTGALSLQEITHLCESYFGRQITVFHNPETRPYDIPYYVTDIRKAQKFWEWQPTQTAEEIVLRLCEWTTQNIDFVRGLFE